MASAVPSSTGTSGSNTVEDAIEMNLNEAVSDAEENPLAARANPSSEASGVKSDEIIITELNPNDVLLGRGM